MTQNRKIAEPYGGSTVYSKKIRYRSYSGQLTPYTKNKKSTGAGTKAPHFHEPPVRKSCGTSYDKLEGHKKSGDAGTKAPHFHEPPVRKSCGAPYTGKMDFSRQDHKKRIDPAKQNRYEKQNNIHRKNAPKNIKFKSYKKGDNTGTKTRTFTAHRYAGPGYAPYDKNEKKAARPKARRLKIRVFAVFSFVVLLGLSAVWAITFLFKTNVITVVGQTRYSENQIIEAAEIKMDDSIFLIDSVTASNHIIKNFPYIEDVNITFNIPDSVNIKVSESVPVFQINVGKKFLQVSSKGRILEITSSKTNITPLIKYPLLAGKIEGDYVCNNNDDLINLLTELKNELEKNEFTEQIKTIDFSNLKKVVLDYDGRIDIDLGPFEDIDYKMRTISKIIQKLDPSSTKIIRGTLDVSKCRETKHSYFRERT